MKHLKKFDKFKESVGFGDSVSGIGADEGTFDHSNSPVLRQQVQAYVDEILYSNQSKIIFDALGLEQPKELEGAEMDSMYDEIRDKAIKFFMKHPHKMVDIQEMDIKQTPIDARSTNTDGVPRTNNIGGTSFNAY